MKKLLISLLFFININVYSQLVSGQFLIGGTQEESSSSTIQLSDGDYLFCGTTKSYGAGGQDLLLIRFNPDFSIDWQKTIGGSLNDFLNNMTQSVENSDGSIMVLGNTNSFGLGNYDILLLKISPTGSIIWSKVYGGINEERACVIRSTLEGGYIISGSTDSYNTPTSTVIERDLFLVKLDSLGNVIWANTWGTTDNNDIYSSNIATQISEIKQLPDSSYLIGGIMEGLGSSNANSILARINSNGSINWFKKYTSSNSAGHEVINNIVVQNNLNAFASGLTTYGSIGTNGRGLLFNFNINTGVVKWSKNYGNMSSNYNWIFKNHMESPNRFVLSMYENGSGFGDYDISCFAIDSNGVILQQKVFGTPNFDLSVFSTSTIDNGYLFSGVSGTGVNKDSYLVKIDNSWSSGCNETNITINNASITINPQNYNPTLVTSVNSSSISLTSIPVNVTIDTLCFNVIDTCNLSVNFSSITTCLGDTTYFTDLSIDSTGNIVDWEWNFGDSTILSGTQIPSHLYTSSGIFNVTLIVTNDNNCVDSITFPITVYAPTTTAQNLTICQGDSIFFGGQFYNTTGMYVDSLQTFNGCDSIVTLDLIMFPTFQILQNQSICQGDSIFFGGQFYNTTGIYIDSLQTLNGCDSIVTIDLTVLSAFQILQNQSICQGDSILLGGNFQYSTGVYTDSLQALAGCDSIVITTLIVNPVYLVNQILSICQGDSIYLGGSFQNSSGIYTDSLQTTSGCDSIITTNLTINPIFNINQNTAICQGDSILLGGSYQNSAGVYTNVYSSDLGCDSTITTTLSIKPSAIETLTPISICDNDSILIFGAYQTAAGTYNQIISNGAINGCDSIVYQELLIHPTYQIFTNATICSGDSIFLGGGYQNISGNYVDVYNSSLGCDSTVTTNLNVVNNFLVNINDTICQGDSIFIAGAYQTISGTYSEMFVSSAGCDSLVIINLSVDSLINLVISDDAYSSPCESVELHVSGGNFYLWSPSSGLSCTNCSNPIASPFETTTYTVTDIGSNCSGNNTVTVFVQGENEIFVPNVFTPNMDGQNDGFNIKASCIKSIHKVIYNRWGMIVFESDQLNEVWDGTTPAGTDVPDGTYFYIFEVTFDINIQTDTKTVFKGTVTLLR